MGFAVTNRVLTIFKAVDATTDVLKKINSSVSKTLGKASKSFSSATDKVNKFSSTLTTGLKWAAGGAVAAGIGLFHIINKVTDSMDQLSVRSKTLNFPIEDLQRFTYAAEQLGVPAETFDSNLGKFTKGFSELKLKSGPLYKALGKMNPALRKQLMGAKDSGEAFKIFIEGMRGAKNEAQLTKLALLGFGKSGIDMKVFAKASKEELAALLEQMDKNGIVTQEQADMADAYGDTLNDLKMTAKSFFVEAITPYLPMMKDFVKSLLDWLQANRGLIQQKISDAIQWLKDNKDMLATWAKNIGLAVAAFYALQTAMNVINAVLKVFTFVSSLVNGAITVLQFTINVARTAFNMLAGPIRALIAGFRMLAMAMISNPFVLLVAAIIAVGALIWYFWDDIQEVLFKVFDFFVEIGGKIKGYWTSLIDVLSDAIMAVADALSAAWDAVVNAVTMAIDWIVEKATAVWDTVVAIFGVYIDVIMGIVQTFIDLFSGNWDAIAVRFMGAFEKVKTFFIGVMDWLMAKLEPLKTFFGSILDIVKGIFGGGGDVNVNTNNGGKPTTGIKPTTDIKPTTGAVVQPSVVHSAPAVSGFAAGASAATGELVVTDKSKKVNVKGKSSGGLRLKMVHTGGM